MVVGGNEGKMKIKGDYDDVMEYDDDDDDVTIGFMSLFLLLLSF